MRDTRLGMLLALGLTLTFALSACAPGARVDTSAISFSKKHRTVTSNEVGSKTGKACKTSILGFITFGEAGYYKAAKDANIKKIGSVHDTYSQVFASLYVKHCTVVTGS